VDGVLVCFDAANKDSLRIVPDILNALICTDVPSLLVACKSNIASRKVDLTLGTRVGAIFGVSAMDAGEDHSSCKPCVKTLLSAILEKRNVQSSRRRGSSIPPGFADLSHPPRQSSDRSNQALSNSSSRDTLVPNPQGRPSRSHTLKQTPPLVILPSLLSMDPGNLPYAASASTQLSINSANLDSRRGSGAVGSEFEEEGFNSEVISVSATDAWELQRDDPLSALDPNREDGQGSTWDELVDKLLAQPKSRTDVYFTTVFLVFYRKYAPPRQLLDSIMLRFDTATETSPDFLVAMMTRSRFCYILSQWVQEHPNDFYYPHTKQSLVSFVRSLADVSSLNHYYLELLPVVEDIPVNVEDPDAFWGLCDADFDDTQIDEMVSGKAGVVNSRHQPFVADLRRNKPEPDIGHPSSPAKGSRKSKDTDTESVAGSTKPASSDTAYDDKKLLNFIDVPDETMARELTRIEWGFFACLKPRDLLRHLWMSSSTKSNFSLVTQMINHFNHISNWVSSVILSRGKAKYRARTLEKFMNIAWLLRNLNNYNTLMAILAGINNASILRLHSTKELVKQRPAYRYFMSLERLMSSDRSFSAYRLAMKMTTGEKIPYL
ncbi:Ras guanine nucleotide exchange factor A, partial [Neolecta irregularis DAH-3]